MMSRCYDPSNKNYSNYGGRGIKVWEPWHDFEMFVVWVQHRPEGHTLDRIDSNGDYKPFNVRWATVTQQNRNLRSNKLTLEDVMHIRELRRAGYVCRHIASLFGVSRQHINDIVNGKDWA